MQWTSKLLKKVTIMTPMSDISWKKLTVFEWESIGSRVYLQLKHSPLSSKLVSLLLHLSWPQFKYGSINNTQCLHLLSFLFFWDACDQTTSWLSEVAWSNESPVSHCTHTKYPNLFSTAKWLTWSWWSVSHSNAMMVSVNCKTWMSHATAEEALTERLNCICQSGSEKSTESTKSNG